MGWCPHPGDGMGPTTHSAQPPSGGIAGCCLDVSKEQGGRELCDARAASPGKRRQVGSLGGLSSAGSWGEGGDDAELRRRQSGAAAVRQERGALTERTRQRETKTKRGRQTERQTDRHTHTDTHELRRGGQGEKKKQLEPSQPGCSEDSPSRSTHLPRGCRLGPPLFRLDSEASSLEQEAWTSKNHLHP